MPSLTEWKSALGRAYRTRGGVMARVTEVTDDITSDENESFIVTCLMVTTGELFFCDHLGRCEAGPDRDLMELNRNTNFSSGATS